MTEIKFRDPKFLRLGARRELHPCCADCADQLVALGIFKTDPFGILEISAGHTFEEARQIVTANHVKRAS